MVLRASRDIAAVKDYLMEHHSDDEIEFVLK
jgi:hypothetical protein